MSYGTNTPFGLQATEIYSGSSYNGQILTQKIASGYNTSLFTGDPITMVQGNLNVTPIGGASWGTFNGTQYKLPNGEYSELPYWTAGTVTFQARDALSFLLSDPATVYRIQVSSSTTLADPAAVSLLKTMIGSNANFAVAAAGTAPPAGISNNPGTGNLFTGNSGYYLDISTVATGSPASNALSLKIVGIPDEPLSDFGVPFNIALVIFNSHAFKGGTGTAGS